MRNIAVFTCGNHGIALRHTGAASVQPWVTHQFNTNLETHTGGYYWGHYYRESCDAIDDFFERCANLQKSENKSWSMEIMEESNG